MVLKTNRKYTQENYGTAGDRQSACKVLVQSVTRPQNQQKTQQIEKHMDCG